MLLTIDDAAAKLRVSPRTIEREIGDGKLTVTMIRSRPRIDEADLQAYLSAQKIRKEAVCLPTSAVIDGTSVLPSAANNSRRRLEQLVRARRYIRYELYGEGKATIFKDGNPVRRDECSIHTGYKWDVRTDF